MKTLALLLTLLVQTPEFPPTPPSPLPSVPRANAVMRGLRLVDVRADGIYSLGSACPVAGFSAYTAAHVVQEVRGQLIALDNHGYNADGKVLHRVHVAWVDDKRDLAMIIPDSGGDAFGYWYTRGPVPIAGAEVRGVLILPPPAHLSVPSFGTFYGENDDRFWSSQVSGPGSSGSCVLDDQDRVFAILTATASWGPDGAHPANLPRASVSVRVPEK